MDDVAFDELLPPDLRAKAAVHQGLARRLAVPNVPHPDGYALHHRDGELEQWIKA